MFRAYPNNFRFHVIARSPAPFIRKEECGATKQSQRRYRLLLAGRQLRPPARNGKHYSGKSLRRSGRPKYLNVLEPVQDLTAAAFLYFGQVSRRMRPSPAPGRRSRCKFVFDRRARGRGLGKRLTFRQCAPVKFASGWP
jgi:hypothetical protein